MAIPCSKCGTINDDGSIYCGTCGTLLSYDTPLPSDQTPSTSSPLPSDQTPSASPPTPPSDQPPSTPPSDQIPQLVIGTSQGQRRRIPKRTRNLVIVVDAVIIIFVIGLALATTKVVPMTPQSQSLSIVTGSFSADQGGYVSYPVTVPNGTSDAQIIGSFEVTSPGGGDIQVYVMNNVNLFIWANNHGNANITTYYKSGVVSSGTIKSGLLSPGTYYLIFDNAFSNSSQKIVGANVSLAYNP